jgi:hypothetical protein
MQEDLWALKRKSSQRNRHKSHKQKHVLRQTDMHQQTGANSENSLPAPTNTSFRINNPKDVVQNEDLNREMRLKMTTNPVNP